MKTDPHEAKRAREPLRAGGAPRKSPRVLPPNPRAGLFRSTVANLSWLLASRGVMAVLSLVYLAIATRTLGVSDFGRFALVTGAAQALATLVGFQTWQVVVRFGVDLAERGDAGGLARFLRQCLWLDVASAVAGAVLAVILVVFFSRTLGISDDLAPAALAYALIQLVTIRSTAVGILRLRDRFSYAAAADSVIPVVRLAGALAAAIAMPTITGFLIGWGAAEVAAAATYWIMLARTGELATIRHAPPATGAAPTGLVRFLLTTNLASTLGLSAKQIPLLLVGGLAGVAQAGAFRLALQLAQALTKLAQLITRAAFPEIIRRLRDADPRLIARAAARGLVASSLAGTVILVVLALAGHVLLAAIGGREFVRGYPVLLWLAAAGCVDLAVVGFEPILFGTGRSGRVVAIRAGAVALQLAATFVLLPRIGATAAAIGVFVGSVATAIVMVAAVLRQPRVARAR